MNGRERYRKNPGAANRMRNTYTNIASYSDSDRAGFFSRPWSMLRRRLI
jgi:hypothetical protein